MNILSPLLIVSFSAEEVVNLENLASSLGYPDSHVVVGGIQDAISALETRSVIPDYMIIDIADGGIDLIPDFRDLALHCDPSIKVVVIGGINDISFYRELRNIGVIEYFSRPVRVSEVRDVLLREVTSSYSSTAAHQRGTVFSCVSAASGDGASTLAVNFAYCLSEELGVPTVLVDMDYQFGWIVKSLDLSAPFGIRELFDYPERGVDESLVDKMTVKYGNNLSIIGSPYELRLLPSVRPDVIRDLVEILRSRFKAVVLDVPHVWTPWTAAALSNSDKVIMVAQLWLRSLTHASRLIAAWKSIGLSSNDITLVINRSGAKFKEAVTAKDFENVCNKTIDAYFSNDIKTTVNAETLGKTIFEVEREAPLQQQLRQFTKNIASFDEQKGISKSDKVLSAPKRSKLLTFLGNK